MNLPHAAGLHEVGDPLMYGNKNSRIIRGEIIEPFLSDMSSQISQSSISTWSSTSA